MIMKRKHINLLWNQSMYGYHLMISPEGVPYYVPDNEIVFEEGVHSDTVLLVPIEEKVFLKDRKSKFCAYRIRYDSFEHSTIVFGTDPNNLSWTEIQITGSVNRVIYSIDRSLCLVVHEERDPMLPPHTTRITAPSEAIGAMVLDSIEEDIQSIGDWLMKHKI